MDVISRADLPDVLSPFQLLPSVGRSLLHRLIVFAPLHGKRNWHSDKSILLNRSGGCSVSAVGPCWAGVVVEPVGQAGAGGGAGVSSGSQTHLSAIGRRDRFGPQAELGQSRNHGGHGGRVVNRRG